MAKEKTKEKLLLIDANSLIYRAYHALPPLSSPDGRPKGALYGLASILIKLFQGDLPSYAGAAFDRPEPTFRKEKFDQYKITRPPTPDDLIPQLEEAKNLLAHFGVQTLEAPGFEADDIIATLAHRFKQEIGQVVILSGDLDTLQVVEGDRVVAEVPKKGISETTIYSAPQVLEKLGVEPAKVPDYKGLVGDQSDNIPGVPGIGPKTAVSLLRKYHSIESIYRNLTEIKEDSSALAKKLKGNEKMAFLSKELATTSRDAPVPKNLTELETKISLDDPELHSYLENLGFKTLVARIKNSQETEKERIGKLF